MSVYQLVTPAGRVGRFVEVGMEHDIEKAGLQWAAEDKAAAREGLELIKLFIDLPANDRAEVMKVAESLTAKSIETQIKH